MSCLVVFRIFMFLVMLNWEVICKCSWKSCEDIFFSVKISRVRKKVLFWVRFYVLIRMFLLEIKFFSILFRRRRRDSLGLKVILLVEL